MVSINRTPNVSRIVTKLVFTILALWVGGIIMSVFGNIMQNTTNTFGEGFELIGWTVGANPTNAGGNWSTSCALPHTYSSTTTLGQNCITDVSGTGLLGIIGIIGLASIIMEFVKF